MIQLKIDSEKRLSVTDPHGIGKRDTGKYLLLFNENNFEEIIVRCACQIHENEIARFFTDLVVIADEEYTYPVEFMIDGDEYESHPIKIDSRLTSRAGEIAVYVRFTNGETVGKTNSVRILIGSNVCEGSKIPSTLRVTPREESQEFSTLSGYRRVEVGAVDAEELSVTPSDERQVYLPQTGKYFNKVTVERPDLSLQDVIAIPSHETQYITSDDEHYAIRSVRVEPASEAFDLQVKRVEPSRSEQIVTPDGVYIGLGEVRVSPVTAAVDANIVPENIRKDIRILGVTGAMDNIEITVDDPEEEVPLARFYDYDGALVGSYTAEELSSMSAVPSPPSHEGLTFARYNRSIESMLHYLRDLHTPVDASALYTVSDGGTRLFLNVGTALGSASLTAELRLTFSNAYVIVDWGDGSSEISIRNTSDILTHTYSEAGQYTVTVSCETGSMTVGSASSSTPVTSDSFLIKGFYSGGNCAFGRGCFKRCRGMEFVTLPMTLTALADNVFEECTSLPFVSVPDGVSSIGTYAFGKCASLMRASLPDSVESIGYNAFESSLSMTGVTLPEGLLALGANAFSGCRSVTYAYLGGHLTELAGEVFSSCSGLQSATIPAGVSVIGERCFQNCCRLKSADLPDAVTTIGEHAFENCVRLSLPSIPSHLTSIGRSAFYMAGIRELSLPESLISIGSQAFSCCRNLRSVTMPAGVTDPETSLFSECPNLMRVRLRAPVIPQNSFFGDYTLSEIEIASSVTTIGNSCFAYCNSLISLEIPSSVTYIDTGFIAYADNIRTVDLSGFSAPPAVSESAFGALNSFVKFIVRDEPTRQLFASAPTWSQIASRLVVKDP